MITRRLFFSAVLLLSFGVVRARAGLIVVDTFDDQDQSNATGGSTNVWGDTKDPSIGVKMSFDPAVRLGAEGGSLRLDFDIASQRDTVFYPPQYSISTPAQRKDDVYNGYYSVLGTPQDLSRYKYLIFWVKGDEKAGYTRSFRLELKDGQAISGTTVSGIQTEWRKMVIPLSRFVEIRDWSHITEWAIVFGPPFVSNKEGTLYFDDVYFSQDPDVDLRTPRPVYLAKRADKVVVDGKLREWDRSEFVEMADVDAFLESGQVSGRSDLRPRFAVKWDAWYLYVAVQVVDNEVVNKQSGANIWRDDSIEVYLEPGGGPLVWDKPEHFQIGLAPAGPEGAVESWLWFQKRKPATEELFLAGGRDRGGYQAEAAIAWPLLGVAPESGKTLSFSLAVNDRDEEDGTIQAKYNWSMNAAGDGTYELGVLRLE